MKGLEPALTWCTSRTLSDTSLSPLPRQRGRGGCMKDRVENVWVSLWVNGKDARLSDQHFVGRATSESVCSRQT